MTNFLKPTWMNLNLKREYGGQHNARLILVYGYYRCLTSEQKKHIEENMTISGLRFSLNELVLFDEDCGWQYSYIVNLKSEPCKNPNCLVQS